MLPKPPFTSQNPGLSKQHEGISCPHPPFPKEVVALNVLLDLVVLWLPEPAAESSGFRFFNQRLTNVQAAFSSWHAKGAEECWREKFGKPRDPQSLWTIINQLVPRILPKDMNSFQPLSNTLSETPQTKCLCQKHQQKVSKGQASPQGDTLLPSLLRLNTGLFRRGARRDCALGASVTMQKWIMGFPLLCVNAL